MSVREVPASIGQRLLWLLDHYRGRVGQLNEQLVWRIRGPLDTGALEEAVDALCRRHETLRTSFAVRGRRLLQAIHEPRQLELLRVDRSDAADRDAAVDELAFEEGSTEIDATVWPVRATLCRFDDEDHLFCLNVHHLAVDGASIEFLARDLAALYNRGVGTPAELPEIGWQYAQWSEWQRERFESGEAARLQEHWARRLEGAEFPALPRREEAPEPSAAPRPVDRVELDPDLAAGLERLALEQRTTLFPLSLALFFAHLWRVTGQRSVALGSLFANRTRPEVTDTVGFFVNMVVLRARVEPDEPFERLLRSTRTVVLDALAHQELPYHMLPPASVRADSPAGQTRADDVVFHFLHSRVDEAQLTGLEIRRFVHAATARRRFPFELAVVQQTWGTEALLLYDDERHDPAFARSFLDGFLETAAEVVAAPHRTLVELGRHPVAVQVENQARS